MKIAKLVQVVAGTAAIAGLSILFVKAGSHIEHQQALEVHKNTINWEFLDEQPIQVMTKPGEENLNQVFPMSPRIPPLPQGMVPVPLPKDFPQLYVIED